MGNVGSGLEWYSRTLPPLTVDWKRFVTILQMQYSTCSSPNQERAGPSLIVKTTWWSLWRPGTFYVEEITCQQETLNGKFAYVQTGTLLNKVSIYHSTARHSHYNLCSSINNCLLQLYLLIASANTG